MSANRQGANKLLAMEHVQSELLTRARPIPQTEHCDLADGADRVLACDVVSPIDVPGFDNSAMDGYVLNAASKQLLGGRFNVVQRIVAGQTGAALLPDQAARIMTGAAIPPGGDVVVPQEDTQRQGDWVEIMGEYRCGQHIRRRGEDIVAGEVILHQGTHLQAKHLGLAASVGLPTLEVYARLKVGMFFTGDELLAPGQCLRPGMIYNSNRYAIGALLRALGCIVTDYGVVPDDAHATRQMLTRASAENDMVLTSGGVSVGEEDHVRAAIEQLGQLELWQVALKPGKPFAYGRLGEADFIGLPGNPVSAYVTFMLLAAPLIKRRQGRRDCLPHKLRAPVDFTWSSKGRVREFVRVVAARDAQDSLSLALSSCKQGAAVMTSIALADGLAEIAVGAQIKPGDAVWFYPFLER